VEIFCTFVDVFTKPSIPVVSCNTGTVVIAWNIAAVGQVVTLVSIKITFINVGTVPTIAFVSAVASTIVGPDEISTIGNVVAFVSVVGAFIVIFTIKAIAVITVMTGALIGAVGVRAVGIVVALVDTSVTFVNISAVKSISIISVVTSTVVGSDSVATVGIDWTSVDIKVAFVDIFANKTIAFESVITSTVVSSGFVDARSIQITFVAIPEVIIAWINGITTFIGVFACNTVTIVSGDAGTFKWLISVDTVSHVVAIISTFIALVNVFAIESATGETIVAFAGVVSYCVITSGIDMAFIGFCCTFIDVIAFTWEATSLVSVVARTVISTWIVITVSIFIAWESISENRVETFINVGTVETIAVVSCITRTGVGSNCICARCISVTLICLCCTFVNIMTFIWEAATIVSVVARAVISSRIVIAIGIFITWKSISENGIETFVNIGAVEPIAFISVDTLAVIETDVISTDRQAILSAFIDSISFVISAGYTEGIGISAFIAIFAHESITVVSSITATVVTAARVVTNSIIRTVMSTVVFINNRENKASFFIILTFVTILANEAVTEVTVVAWALIRAVSVNTGSIVDITVVGFFKTLVNVGTFKSIAGPSIVTGAVVVRDLIDAHGIDIA
jgi:hypothetical protein